VTTCGLGGLGALFAIGLGFFPPSQLASSGINAPAFIGFLAGGLALGLGLPLVISRTRRPLPPKSGGSAPSTPI